MTVSVEQVQDLLQLTLENVTREYRKKAISTSDSFSKIKWDEKNRCVKIDKFNVLPLFGF